MSSSIMGMLRNLDLRFEMKAEVRKQKPGSVFNHLHLNSIWRHCGLRKRSQRNEEAKKRRSEETENAGARGEGKDFGHGLARIREAFDLCEPVPCGIFFVMEGIRKRE
jgi:hypothetical protein